MTWPFQHKQLSPFSKSAVLEVSNESSSSKIATCINLSVQAQYTKCTMAAPAREQHMFPFAAVAFCLSLSCFTGKRARFGHKGLPNAKLNAWLLLYNLKTRRLQHNFAGFFFDPQNRISTRMRATIFIGNAAPEFTCTFTSAEYTHNLQLVSHSQIKTREESLLAQ